MLEADTRLKAQHRLTRLSQGGGRPWQCRGSRAWIPAALVMALAACAGTVPGDPPAPLSDEQHAILSMAATARVDAMRRAGSAKELARFAKAGEQFVGLRRSLGLGIESTTTDVPLAVPLVMPMLDGIPATGAASAPVYGSGQGLAAQDLDRIEVTGSRISAADVITNTQEAGVDEGDIVKKLGDRLLVLRKGWLHVVSLVDGDRDDLRLLASEPVNASPEEAEIWYDELLTFGDGLVVLGFNFDADISELFVFQVDDFGGLIRGPRLQVRSEDYYSGHNVGARVHGDRLLLSLVADLELDPDGSGNWPFWRRADGDEGWAMLVEPEGLYLPLLVTESPVVRLVLDCALDGLLAGTLDCRTTGIVSDDEAEFYASGNAAYLLVMGWEDEAWLDPRFSPRRVDWDDRLADLRRHRVTIVYRIPNDGAPPTVARLRGVPGNQFALKEVGDSLYAATEVHDAGGTRRIALTRIGLSDFSDRIHDPRREVALLDVEETHRSVRLTDDALWLGEHTYAMREEERTHRASTLLVQPFDGPPARRVPLVHSVDRIEPLGDRVFLSGRNDQDDWVMALAQQNRAARRPGVTVGSPVAVHSHVPADTRSQAFNRGALSDGSEWLGLPGFLRLADDPKSWGRWFGNQVADIVYLRADGTHLGVPAILSMQDIDAPHPDELDESHWDWYGNARLFFIGDRVFALSGALLKEARLDRNGVREVRSIALE
ncbi:MAG TPA: beta-propeller domain-containing protein [Xanthomonadaceae bacterium]|nr:beta-propeller domain-containing protein [Xanthomonadaceae bacterium]